MNAPIVELSKQPNAHKLLYKYNHSIGCTLDDDSLNQWISKILSIGDPIAIIEGEEIIAFLLLYCNKKDTLEAYICNVFVNELYRGNNLSKLLIERAIDICKQRCFKVVDLDVAENNTPARSVYIKCGFIETMRYKKDSINYIHMSYIL